MATLKRLNIVVDGTAAMGAYWSTLVFSYLGNIVRCFHGQSTEEGTAEDRVELGMTVYGTRQNVHAVHVTQWTTNMELFLEALSKLSFNGGNGGGAPEEPAIAEGLAGALLMFSKRIDGTPSKEYYADERHCVLVAVAEPIFFPSPLFVPSIVEGRLRDDLAEWHVTNAMEVAHMFPKYAVSLSVVLPHQLPLLREIFIQGNNVAEGSNTGVSEFSNGGQFLLLFSDKLLEACNPVKHVQAPEFAQGAEENLLVQQGCLKEDDNINGMNSGKNHVESNTVSLMEVEPVASGCAIPHSDNASSSHTHMSIFADMVAELDAGLVVLSPSKPVTRGNLFDELKRLRAESSFTGAIGRRQTEAMARIPGPDMSLQHRTKTMDPKSIARSRRHALQKKKRLARQASTGLTQRESKSQKRTNRRRFKKFRSLSKIAPAYNPTPRPLYTISSPAVMNASAIGDSSMIMSQCGSLSRSFGTRQYSSYVSSSSAMDTRGESSRMGSARNNTNAFGEFIMQTNTNAKFQMVDILEEPEVEIVPPPVEMSDRNHEGHVLKWGVSILQNKMKNTET